MSLTGMEAKREEAYQAFFKALWQMREVTVDTDQGRELFWHVVESTTAAVDEAVHNKMPYSTMQKLLKEIEALVEVSRHVPA